MYLFALSAQRPVGSFFMHEALHHRQATPLWVIVSWHVVCRYDIQTKVFIKESFYYYLSLINSPLLSLNIFLLFSVPFVLFFSHFTPMRSG